MSTRLAETLYSGSSINFGLSETPIGRKPLLEFPEAAGVLVFNTDFRLSPPGNTVLKILMVEQYRPGCDTLSLEIPAGKTEAGENIRDCAQREVREETGVSIRNLQPLVSYYPAIGIMTEILHLFTAVAASQGAAEPDPDEKIRIIEMPFTELVEQVKAGGIRDGKTVLAVSYLLLQAGCQ